MEKKNWKFKLGLILVIVSIPLFLVLPFIYSLGYEAATTVTITTVTFVAAEVLFWAGGLLLGKELFTKYKSYLNPKNWFKKKDEETDATDKL